MTTPINRETLREALRQTGNDRPFRGAHNDQYLDLQLDLWCAGLRAFVDEYSKRFGEMLDPFAWLPVSPLKAKAFFQIDTLNLSPEMKIAVWRILLGSEIRALETVFRPEEEKTDLCLVLRPPYADAGAYETYQSDKPDDIRLIRHLGTIRVNNRLELQGYYAFAS